MFAFFQRFGRAPTSELELQAFNSQSLPLGSAPAQPAAFGPLALPAQQAAAPEPVVFPGLGPPPGPQVAPPQSDFEQLISRVGGSDSDGLADSVARVRLGGGSGGFQPVGSIGGGGRVQERKSGPVSGSGAGEAIIQKLALEQQLRAQNEQARRQAVTSLITSLVGGGGGIGGGFLGG
ncbi:MAG: hypothetical protein ABFS46_08830 [Myxococcota bacterium]